MGTPKVSIVIPTYNQALFVSKAIDSCLNLTYSNIEVIVADDFSNDDTPVIVTRYLRDNRIKYFRTSENIGRVNNYRRALEFYATGVWVINLDGDDYFDDPAFLTDFINYYDKANNSEIVFIQAGHKEYLVEEGRVIHIAVPVIGGEVEVMSGRNYFLNFHKSVQFSHLATMYKRQLALSIDFYRHNILSTDVESILRLALHGDVMLIKRTIGVWVKHHTNASSTASLRQTIDNMEIINSCFNYAQKFGFQEKELGDWKDRMSAIYFISFLKVAKKTLCVSPIISHILFVLKVLCVRLPSLISNRFVWRSLLKKPI